MCCRMFDVKSTGVQNADPDVRKDMETFLSRVAVPEVRCPAECMVACSLSRSIASCCCEPNWSPRPNSELQDALLFWSSSAAWCQCRQPQTPFELQGPKAPWVHTDEGVTACFRHESVCFRLCSICQIDSRLVCLTAGDDDMPAHVKSSMFGCSLNVPITNGRLNLGTWQGEPDHTCMQEQGPVE